MIDYHIHTARCHHATGTPQEYIAEARLKGLTEIGFADHFPLDLLNIIPSSPVSMSAEELHAYLEEIRELAEKNKDITIRLGLEVDYIPGRTEEAADSFLSLPVDYLIGSLHFLGSWDFTHPAEKSTYLEKDLNELYENYFADMGKLCRSGLFDIVGHIDVIKKFGFLPQMPLDQLWLKTAKELKENDLCLEINTAGLRAPVKEMYPAPGFLQYCFQENVPVTVGSDAHSPQEVGYKIDDAIALLRKVGYREVATFIGRKRQMISLEGG